ncbi:putative oxoglutarate/iron-dependent dioxygenase, non-heme dioxygenase domain-containing protein [Dioscorea sansibarensis]
MGTESRVEIPKIDFSGVELAKIGTQEWDKAKEKVMEALEKHGCFEAVFDKVTTELRDEFFGPVLDELFKVPLDLKIRNYSDKPLQGYIPRRPELGCNFESLVVKDASSYSSIQAFASLLLINHHQANPSFCEVTWKFAREVAELELMVRRMMVEGLGAEKHFGGLVKSTTHMMRMAEYGPPANQETKVAMTTHRDMNLLTIICQHHGEGLELQTKSGDWFRASPCSFTVIIGESFQV